MRLRPTLLLLLVLGGCLGRESVADVQAPISLALEQVTGDVSQPVHVWFDPDQPGSIYVVEQGGRVLRMDRDGSDQEPVLDIRDRVGSGGERGLFAIAFNPAIKDRLYVHYTDTSGNTVVSSFARGQERADPDSEAVFLRQEQPYPNHNGGQIVFDQDGRLFVGLGDGGGAGDPHENGQKLSTMLGKILRIRPGAGTDYEIPEDNPFHGRDGARPEIWAYGLRNPWRFSFDRQTGDLFIGDVGQNQWEEINRLRAGDEAGANLGWNRFEGSHPFRGGATVRDHVKPIHEYATGPGGTCAVTGGHVYRGEALAGLQGVYVFADYCSGTVWGLVPKDDDWGLTEFLRTDHKISSFGEDAQGELYLCDIQGGVYRFVAA